MRGASLIESLITVVLLSVALLGLAMLQAQGLKFSTGSYARTQANLLAYDIIDRMRVMAVDPTVTMADYAADDPDGTCVYEGNVAANQVITNDLNCWYSKLEDTLPGATGSITQNGALMTVTVTWTDQSIRTQSANQKQVVITFQPTVIAVAA